MLEYRDDTYVIEEDPICSQEYDEDKEYLFRKRLAEILVHSRLKPKYISVLCDEDSIKIYKQVFTHSSADPQNNYEVYETLGDSTLKRFIIWYVFKRFPQLNKPEGVQIISRMLIKWGSKDMFFKIADSLGFFRFIRADKLTKQTKRKPLMEDVFEAFVGATESILDKKFTKGVGFAIVNNILEAIFNKLPMELSYEQLYDSKTILKEIFDKNKQLGTLEYVTTAIEGAKHPSGFAMHETQIFHTIKDGELIKTINFDSRMYPPRTNPKDALEFSAKQFIFNLLASESLDQIKKKIDNYTYKIQQSGPYNNWNVNIYTNKKIPLGNKGIAPLKIDSEQNAAKSAIASLQTRGIKKDIPDIFKTV